MGLVMMDINNQMITLSVNSSNGFIRVIDVNIGKIF